MTNKEALKKAVHLVSPYNPGAGWDFDSNLKHLNTIIKYIPKTTSVFDAGCGRGTLTLALKFLGYKVEGGDKYIFEGKNSYSIQDIEGISILFKRKYKSQAIFFFLTIWYFALIYGLLTPTGVQRYRVILIPILIFIAVFGVDYLWTIYCRRRSKKQNI